MKKDFEEPMIEIVKFITEDVMTISANMHDVGDVDWGIYKPTSGE